MWKNILFGMFAASFLSGCITPEQKAAADARAAEIESTRPVCDGEKDCAAKWDAAQLWVVHNAGMKIQTTTNVLIETYNSRDTSLAVQVTKEPAGDGKYRIVMRPSCGNPFGCYPDLRESALAFNHEVGSAK